jgi:16S rRNA (guanine966-N2)-methyltransferase
MTQVVRLIGGVHRGKKIAFPEIDGLRPTPSRIRETLFNWLMHTVRGAKCLDAFAGSGALGFEAWSRGAAEIHFVETSHTAFMSLQKQISALDTRALQITKSSALTFLAHTTEQFNLVFLDPPFDTPALLDHCIEQLEARPILAKQGLVYTESAQPITLNPALWHTLKAKKAGLVYYALHEQRET